MVNSPGGFGCRGYKSCYASSRIIAEPFSPVMTEGAFVLPDVMVGMMEASTPRSEATPRTRKRWSRTAIGSSADPILTVTTGSKIVVAIS